MKFATIKSVQEVFNFEISESTACRYIQLVRNVYEIDKPKKVPIEKITEYFGITK